MCTMTRATMRDKMSAICSNQHARTHADAQTCAHTWAHAARHAGTTRAGGRKQIRRVGRKFHIEFIRMQNVFNAYNKQNRHALCVFVCVRAAFVCAGSLRVRTSAVFLGAVIYGAVAGEFFLHQPVEKLLLNLNAHTNRRARARTHTHKHSLCIMTSLCLCLSRALCVRAFFCASLASVMLF